MKYTLEKTQDKTKTAITTATSMRELKQKHSEFVESLKKNNNIDWTAGYFVQAKDGASYMWIEEKGQEVKI
jgi:hypothetical protein